MKKSLILTTLVICFIAIIIFNFPFGPQLQKESKKDAQEQPEVQPEPKSAHITSDENKITFSYGDMTHVIQVHLSQAGEKCHIEKVTINEKSIPVFKPQDIACVKGIVSRLIAADVRNSDDLAINILGRGDFFVNYSQGEFAENLELALEMIEYKPYDSVEYQYGVELSYQDIPFQSANLQKDGYIVALGKPRPVQNGVEGLYHAQLFLISPNGEMKTVFTDFETGMCESPFFGSLPAYYSEVDEILITPACLDWMKVRDVPTRLYSLKEKNDVLTYDKEQISDNDELVVKKNGKEYRFTTLQNQLPCPTFDENFRCGLASLNSILLDGNEIYHLPRPVVTREAEMGPPRRFFFIGADVDANKRFFTVRVENVSVSIDIDNFPKVLESSQVPLRSMDLTEKYEFSAPSGWTAFDVGQFRLLPYDINDPACVQLFHQEYFEFVLFDKNLDQISIPGAVCNANFIKVARYGTADSLRDFVKNQYSQSDFVKNYYSKDGYSAVGSPPVFDFYEEKIGDEKFTVVNRLDITSGLLTDVFLEEFELQKRYWIRSSLPFDQLKDLFLMDFSKGVINRKQEYPRYHD
jgi:hypothetical protein